MIGGKTALKELDITVPAFKCDAVTGVTLVKSESEEYAVTGSDDDSIIKKVDVIKALFKIETGEKDKLADCADV